MTDQNCVPNGYVEDYPHSDFGHPCTSPCCFPEAYGPFPWTCESKDHGGPLCFRRLKERGLCVEHAEKLGMLNQPVLGTLRQVFG